MQTSQQFVANYRNWPFITKNMMKFQKSTQLQKFKQNKDNLGFMRVKCQSSIEVVIYDRNFSPN